MIYDTHEIKFNVPNLRLSKLQEPSWFINNITLSPPILHPNFYSYVTHYFSFLSRRLGIICLNLVSNGSVGKMLRTWVWTSFSLAWWHTSVIPELGVRDRQISGACCHTVKHKGWAPGSVRNFLSINKEERDWGRLPSVRLCLHTYDHNPCVHTCICHTHTKEKERACSALIHISDLPVLFVTTTTPTPDYWALGLRLQRNGMESGHGGECHV